MAQPDYLSLNPGEQVILTAHRHWANIAPFFASTAIVIVAGFMVISYVGANQGSPTTLLPGITLGMITPAVALLDIFAFLILFFAYTIYRQNQIVLTNMHFVQITQAGLFGRTLSKLSLDELQDVRGTRKGVMGTIFNYGDILIETAGTQENFLFRPVADPLSVAETINDTHETYEQHRQNVTVEELERAGADVASDGHAPMAPGVPPAVAPEALLRYQRQQRQESQPTPPDDQQNPPSEFPPSAFSD